MTFATNTYDIIDNDVLSNLPDTPSDAQSNAILPFDQ